MRYYNVVDWFGLLTLYWFDLGFWVWGGLFVCVCEWFCGFVCFGLVSLVAFGCFGGLCLVRFLSCGVLVLFL